MKLLKHGYAKNIIINKFEHVITKNTYEYPNNANKLYVP